jgi:hypothetical protein
MLSPLFLALEPAGFFEDVWASQLIVPHLTRCFTTAFPAAWTLLTHDYLSALQISLETRKSLQHTRIT